MGGNDRYYQDADSGSVGPVVFCGGDGQDVAHGLLARVRRFLGLYAFSRDGSLLSVKL